MTASVASAAQAEAALPRRSAGGQEPAARLAGIVAAMQRPAAVAAPLLGRSRHDRPVGRHQPLEKLASEPNRVDHLHLRFSQLGGEPLGTTLNKFFEGLRLSGPRET